MALKKWDDIATLADVIPYVAAEAAQAKKECPGAYSAYANALSNAKNYQKVWGGTSMDNAYTIAVKTEVEQARQTWYSVGCTAPGAKTPAAKPTAAPESSGEGWWADVQQEMEAPAAPEVQAMGMGGGSWLIWLLAGAGFYLLYTGTKGGKGGRKPRAKKAKTAKRSTRRRR